MGRKKPKLGESKEDARGMRSLKSHGFLEEVAGQRTEVTPPAAGGARTARCEMAKPVDVVADAVGGDGGGAVEDGDREGRDKRAKVKSAIPPIPDATREVFWTVDRGAFRGLEVGEVQRLDRWSDFGTEDDASMYATVVLEADREGGPAAKRTRGAGTARETRGGLVPPVGATAGTSSDDDVVCVDVVAGASAVAGKTRAGLVPPGMAGKSTRIDGAGRGTADVIDLVSDEDVDEDDGRGFSGAVTGRSEEADDDERKVRAAAEDLIEAVSEQIERAVITGNFPAARAAASKIARVVYNDNEKAHFAFGDGDETACIAKWLNKFKHNDRAARSARSLCGLFSSGAEWFATCSGRETKDRYAFNPSTNRYLCMSQRKGAASSHGYIFNAWNGTSLGSILGVTLGGHHLFIDAEDDFYRHFHRHSDTDAAVDEEAIGIIQLGAAAKISFCQSPSGKPEIEITRSLFDASFMMPAGRRTLHEVAPVDRSRGSPAACGSVLKVRTELLAGQCQSLSAVDICFVAYAKSVASVVVGIMKDRLDCEATEPDPIVAPESFQRSGMSQFGILRSRTLNQALEKAPPLDKNLRRADGRPVPNRKSELGVLNVNLLNQALEKAQPLNPSRTLQNGCKVETRKQELASTTKLGAMNVSADHRKLQLRWGDGHSCEISGTVQKGDKNRWVASLQSYSTSRGALQSLYEYANEEKLSHEYAVSNLPKRTLTLKNGWNCEPPYTDELQKTQPGSFGSLLRELVAKQKIVVNVVQITATSKSKRNR